MFFSWYFLVFIHVTFFYIKIRAFFAKSIGKRKKNSIISMVKRLLIFPFFLPFFPFFLSRLFLPSCLVGLWARGRHASRSQAWLNQGSGAQTEIKLSRKKIHKIFLFVKSAKMFLLYSCFIFFVVVSFPFPPYFIKDRMMTKKLFRFIPFP